MLGMVCSVFCVLCFVFCVLCFVCHLLRATLTSCHSRLRFACAHFPFPFPFAVPVFVPVSVPLFVFRNGDDVKEKRGVPASLLDEPMMPWIEDQGKQNLTP